MPDVVSYLSARADEPVALGQLANGIGVEPGRLQRAMSNAVSSGVYGAALECVHRGQVWVWRGEKHTTVAPMTPLAAPVTAAPVAPTPVQSQRLRKGDVVEIMGLTQDGDAVATDEHGRLFRVVPL